MKDYKWKICFHQFVNEGLKEENSLISSIVYFETLIIKSKICVSPGYICTALNGPSPLSRSYNFLAFNFRKKRKSCLK